MTAFLAQNFVPLMFAGLFVFLLSGIPVAFGLAATGLLFAVPSIALIHYGVRDGSWMLPVGLGMTGYGFIYFLFHDVVVHRRVRVRGVPQWRYLRRIIKAHLVHHRTHGRDGARSFGFLYAPREFTER